MVGKLGRIKRWIHHRASRAASLYLIVGLGNPGERYGGNRHNIGFQCIDYMVGAHQIPLLGGRFKALLGEGKVGSRRVIAAKPLTFVNDSGKAVARIAKTRGVPVERILVIHDDLDLPLGRIRLRPGGGSGGHKGVDSIIAELGTPRFARVRVGIGRPARGDPTDYVLGDFDPDQEPIVERVYRLVERAVLCFLEEGIQKAMNSYNAPGV
ncbi:MAG TPA: aminoacyl-tRNA hydrolase [Anaerolineae bacterium]|nr:aminoacyl-tRNA hydrolase [Anaerolineae bacterium]